MTLCVVQKAVFLCFLFCAQSLQSVLISEPRLHLIEQPSCEINIFPEALSGPPSEMLPLLQLWHGNSRVLHYAPVPETLATDTSWLRRSTEVATSAQPPQLISVIAKGIIRPDSQEAVVYQSCNTILLTIGQGADASVFVPGDSNFPPIAGTPISMLAWNDGQSVSLGGCHRAVSKD